MAKIEHIIVVAKRDNEGWPLWDAAYAQLARAFDEWRVKVGPEHIWATRINEEYRRDLSCDCCVGLVILYEERHG